ncbi:hypothetical protein B484DRAFT_389949, partial [Ochromonadaceae sp. CCMP2298]
MKSQEEKLESQEVLLKSQESLLGSQEAVQREREEGAETQIQIQIQIQAQVQAQQQRQAQQAVAEKMAFDRLYSHKLCLDSQLAQARQEAEAQRRATAEVRVECAALLRAAEGAAEGARREAEDAGIKQRAAELAQLRVGERQEIALGEVEAQLQESTVGLERLRGELAYC